MAKVAFSTAEQMYEPLPEGEYPGTLANVEKNDGKKGTYFKLEFDVQAEGHDEAKVWTNASIARRALLRTKQNLVKLGMDPEYLNSDPDEDDLYDEIRNCIGNEVTLVITQEEYTPDDPEEESRTVNKVEKILSAGATAFALP